MGIRSLLVSPEFLVELLKMREHRPRTYSVVKALPDDARLVSAASTMDDPATVLFVLESSDWSDEQAPIFLPRIRVDIHFLSDAELEALQRATADGARG